MTHKEFIQNLSEHLQLSKTKTSSYCKSLVELIRETLKKEDVNVKGFGKFIFEENKQPKFQPTRNLLQEINIK